MLARMRSIWLVVLFIVPAVSAAGTQEGIAAFNARRFTEASRLLKPAADSGDAEAQYYLARTQRVQWAFQHGGKRPDPDDRAQQESHVWFEKAARQGHFPSMAAYAEDFDQGFGVAVDFTAAREWMEKAAAAKEPNALYGLAQWYREGHIYPPDRAKAKAMSEQASAASPKKGEYDKVSEGLRAFGQQQRKFRNNLDPDRDARLMREAKAGNAESARKVAEQALNSTEHERDCATAQQWFQRAGELGDDFSFYQLGDLAYFGECPPQDFARAREFFLKAAALGSVAAYSRLANMAMFGHGAPVDYAAAYLSLRIRDSLAVGFSREDTGVLQFLRKQLTSTRVAELDAQAARQAAPLTAKQAREKEAKTTRRVISQSGDAASTKSWSHSLVLVDDTGRCAESKSSCDFVEFETVLEIRNPEAVTLDCHLSLKTRDLVRPTQLERRFIVLPHLNRKPVLPETRGPIDADGTKLECERVAKPTVAAGTCWAQAPDDADLREFIPPELAERGVYGRTGLAMTFTGSPSRPARVEVRQTSAVPEVDAAVAAFAQATEFQTNCIGEPVPLTLSFGTPPRAPTDPPAPPPRPR
jgi:TPR repeat protein